MSKETTRIPPAPLYLDPVQVATSCIVQGQDDLPRVAVVITNYNYAAFLPDALDSVLAQSYPHMDIVVVDDGSTDDSLEILQRYVQSGVQVIAQSNAGASAARNAGISATTAPLIAFLDADDRWLPDKLCQQVEVLRRYPDVGVVSGWTVWSNAASGKRRLVRRGNTRGRPFHEMLAVVNIVGNPSLTLIRRRVIDDVGGFDPGLRWGNDWEFFARLALVTQFAFLQTSLAEYRWHASNLSSQEPETRLDYLEGIAERLIMQLPRQRQKTVRRWRQAYFTYLRGNLLLARHGSRRLAIRYMLVALLRDPRMEPRRKLVLLLQATVGRRRFRTLKSYVRTALRG